MSYCVANFLLSEMACANEIFEIEFLIISLCCEQSKERTSIEIGQQYIAAWKKFYPSKAFDRGFHSSIFQLEDFSKTEIERWITFNESVSSRYYLWDSSVRYEQVDYCMFGWTEPKTACIRLDMVKHGYPELSALL